MTATAGDYLVVFHTYRLGVLADSVVFFLMESDLNAENLTVLTGKVFDDYMVRYFEKDEGTVRKQTVTTIHGLFKL